MGKGQADKKCKGKIGYLSYGIAVEAMEAMEKKRKVKFDIFKCWYCKNYHLGTRYKYKPKKKRGKGSERY